MNSQRGVSQPLTATQALMIDLMKRPEGTTVEQIAAATGWQHHYADVRIMPR